jgi:hypothetical protein
MLMKRFIACALCGSMAVVLTNVAEQKVQRAAAEAAGLHTGQQLAPKVSGQRVGLVPTAHRDGAAGLGG